MKKTDLKVNKIIDKIMSKQSTKDNRKHSLFHGNPMICPYETKVSRDIRVLSEVEKIWIIFDGDNNGSLNKEEVQAYLNYIAGTTMKLSQGQVDEIYGLIDTDNDGQIDKDEMQVFLKALMILD